MREKDLLVERRKSPRFSIVLRAECQWLQRRKKFLAQLGDMSTGGVRAYSQTPAQKGDRLRISIGMEKGKDLDLDEAVDAFLSSSP